MSQALSAEIAMPTTRYQGSKRKVLPRLQSVLEALEFSTALDAFGGTGAVSHLMRSMGATVCYNDVLASNCAIAAALFSDRPLPLDELSIDSLFERRSDVRYENHIERLYADIYYTAEENRTLDTVVQNIHRLPLHQGRNEAFYVLFQAMLSKRPYNLFHRANLAMRTSDVRRSFGNKATWDRPFIVHMKRFLQELKRYRACRAGAVTIRHGSAFDCPSDFDLVYIDPPYARSIRTQESNYFNFYHFLDAMIRYDEIPTLIRTGEKHRPIYPPGMNWHPFADLKSAFGALIDRFSACTVAISYRDDGYPSIDELVHLVERRFARVYVEDIAEYSYALAKRGRGSREVVVVGEGRTARQTRD